MYPEGVPYMHRWASNGNDNISDIYYNNYNVQHDARKELTFGQIYAKKHLSKYLDITKFIQSDSVTESMNQLISFDFKIYSTVHPGYLQPFYNNTRSPSPPEFIGMALTKNVSNGKSSQYEKWLFDTGATSHVTGSDKFLHNKTFGKDYISVVGGTKYWAECTGDLILRSREGPVLILRDVMYIPQARNIISGTRLAANKTHTMQLDDRGFTLVCKEGKRASLTMALDEDNGLWYFLGTRQREGRSQLVSAVTHNTATDHKKVDNKNKHSKNSFCPYSENHHPHSMDINEAHQRLGHVGESILRSTMRSHNIKLTGTLLPCDACMLHKATKKPTRKVTSIVANRPGERMYVDTSGPFPRTLGGSHYCVKFCDQFSGMSWNIFVKDRSMVPQAIETKILQLLGRGFRVKHLRFDNAGEHQTIENFCLKLGIQPEGTAPNTPQHNGIVERRFATDLRRAQAMMEAADLTVGLRNLLRGEALQTATFIGNMTVSPNTKDNKTPYEKFYGKPPALQPHQLIQFGRIGYATKHESIKSKYKPKAFKCLFMGYSPYHSTSTYRIYNPATKRVVLSRDVKWAAWNIVDPKQSLRQHNNLYMKELINDTPWTDTQKSNFNKLLDHYIAPDTHLTAVMHSENNDSSATYDSDDDVWGPAPSHLGHQHPFTYPRNQEETILRNASIDDNSNHTGDNSENDEIEALDDDNSGNNNDIEEQENADDASEHTEEDRIDELNENNEEENFELPDLEDMNEINNQTKSKQKHSRELKNLGVIPKTSVPKQVQKLNTYYNPTFTEQVNMAIASDPGEPNSMKEALNGPEKEKWKEAIRKEINNFIQRGVWKKISREDVTKRQKRKLISTKWVFKKKVEQDKSIRYKARCVSRGFMQIPGVDYTESFSPVATDSSIRIIIALYLYCNKHKPEKQWVLEMFDVEAAFLNAELDQPTFIEWPQGMEELGFISEEEKTRILYSTNQSNVWKH